MRYRITHKTTYNYSSQVTQSHHLAHLSPRRHDEQAVEAHELQVSPAPTQRRDYDDYFGNPVSHLTIDDDHDVLSVEATTTIAVERRPATQSAASPAWESVRHMMLAAEHFKTAEFACVSHFTRANREIADYGRASFAPNRPLLDAVAELTSRIYKDFDYDGSITDVSTQVEKVFEIKGGVCQDFAHLQLACLRALGLPARYISGYLRTYPPKGQPRLVGADASHAWISVWCPANGWVDYDPTNNKRVENEHITLAHGRDFIDVSPITGIILGGGDHFVDVSVDVLPLDNPAD